jgi:alkylhydroperoxidase family enzyme
MHSLRLTLVSLCLCLPLAAADTPLSALEQQAHARVSATQPRVPLAPQSAELFNGIDGLEAPGSGLVPNYLRAIAVLPKMPVPFSHLFKTFISSSALPSETKLGMALRIAQINQSAYTVAHVERLLGATERGRMILSALQHGKVSTLTAQEQQALAYADALTRNVAGLSDPEFHVARGVYNDSQIVELSFTVCFFNYFTRFAEGLNLPVEPWVFETKPAALPPAPAAPARVSLVSDDEIHAVETIIAAGKATNSPTASWGIGIANSQRAMLNAPNMMLAWRAFGAAAQQYTSVSREIKLDVSFTVSTANGCRYCTLHQVLGLRRLGVDPAKMMSMHKDDSVLRPDELAAVLYARKLTATPAGTTDADFQSLRDVFKEQGALEVLMQTCNFAFMNRFTDGLRLPSEDEAVKVYQETYGRSWERK